jgi:hypothetical protein
LTKDSKTPLDLLALSNGKQEKIVQKIKLESGIYKGVVFDFSPEFESIYVNNSGLQKIF